MIWNSSCLNCTFCAKAFRSPDDGQEKSFSLKENERKKIVNSNFDFLHSPPDYLQCEEGLWSEALSVADIDSLRDRLQHNKLLNRKCKFYYSFENGKGKFFPSIRRERELSRKIRTEKRANLSLAIAIISLLITAITFYFVSAGKFEILRNSILIEDTSK